MDLELQRKGISQFNLWTTTRQGMILWEIPSGHVDLCHISNTVFLLLKRHMNLQKGHETKSIQQLQNELNISFFSISLHRGNKILKFKQNPRNSEH